MVSIVSTVSTWLHFDDNELTKLKKRDKIKCLSWHKNGFILLYKRLEQGRFYFDFKANQGVTEMNMDELQWLLAGLEWQKMRHWRELSYDKFS